MKISQELFLFFEYETVSVGVGIVPIYEKKENFILLNMELCV